MGIIVVYCFRFNDQLIETEYNQLLRSLPERDIKKNLAFKRWQDKQAHLFGRLLLQKAMKDRGSGEVLGNVCYNQFGKPFLDSEFKFNISHSGNYVVCAFSLGLELGIDIEKKTNLCFTDYISVMSPKQCSEIHNSGCSSDTFFKFWSL